MTKRHNIAATVLLAAALVVAPAPARASVPPVAQQWSTLMRQSLAVTGALRTTLAARQATFAVRVAAVSKAKIANTAAQTALVDAATADATARLRSTAARDTLTAAKNNLTALSRRADRNAAAVARAKKAVTAATKTVATRKAEAQRTAAAFKTAQARAATATAGLGTAIAAWKASNLAVQAARQKLAASVTDGYRAQAAAISQDVVTQVRAGFTVADTTQVYGVTVHKNVAYAFKRLLDDAKADGVALSGGGFRTKERQAELRKINGCPDVWTAPASSCRVPTAIPGRSLHELGLAVDVTSGGRTIASGSTAFRWLTAHAADYGFVNLPSEAWHWSITGS